MCEIVLDKQTQRLMLHQERMGVLSAVSTEKARKKATEKSVVVRCLDPDARDESNLFVTELFGKDNNKCALISNAGIIYRLAKSSTLPRELVEASRVSFWYDLGLAIQQGWSKILLQPHLPCRVGHANNFGLMETLEGVVELKDEILGKHKGASVLKILQVKFPNNPEDLIDEFKEREWVGKTIYFHIGRRSNEKEKTSTPH